VPIKCRVVLHDMTFEGPTAIVHGRIHGQWPHDITEFSVTGTIYEWVKRDLFSAFPEVVGIVMIKLRRAKGDG
jgi:hypothetical protein